MKPVDRRMCCVVESAGYEGFHMVLCIIKLTIDYNLVRSDGRTVGSTGPFSVLVESVSPASL